MLRIVLTFNFLLVSVSFCCTPRTVFNPLHKYLLFFFLKQIQVYVLFVFQSEIRVSIIHSDANKIYMSTNI